MKGQSMRLTTRTDLAIRALMFCAANPGKLVRKCDVALACNASLNHLGLVVNLLSQAGFIDTTRGRKGGLQLARASKEISIGAVCRKLEADTPLTECFSLTGNTCPLSCHCRLRGALSRAIHAFYASLDQVSLADLSDDNPALSRLLQLEDA